MYLQIVTFAGPRNDALVAASQRAGRERIAPLIAADPTLAAGLLGGFRAVGPDGHEVVVTLATNEETLNTLGRVIMGSELLDGEDPALLPGPTSVERYPVEDVFGSLTQDFDPVRP